jgi:hypothetical protein
MPKKSKGGLQSNQDTSTSKNQNQDDRPSRNLQNIKQMSEVPGTKSKKFDQVKSKVSTFRSQNDSKDGSEIQSVKTAGRDARLEKKSQPTLVMTSNLPGNGLFSYASSNTYAKQESAVSI